jgi:hypothetical protein
MSVNPASEYLDQLFIFSKLDLQRKLDHFQDYYNEDRVYSSLDLKTPKAMANETIVTGIAPGLPSYAFGSLVHHFRSKAAARISSVHG